LRLRRPLAIAMPVRHVGTRLFEGRASLGVVFRLPRILILCGAPRLGHQPLSHTLPLYFWKTLTLPLPNIIIKVALGVNIGRVAELAEGEALGSSDRRNVYLINWKPSYGCRTQRTAFRRHGKLTVGFYKLESCSGLGLSIGISRLTMATWGPSEACAGRTYHLTIHCLHSRRTRYLSTI
jgi:hypothetical protein